MTSIREVMARAIEPHMWFNDGGYPTERSRAETRKHQSEVAADNVLRALSDEGKAVVPIEPTPEMKSAATFYGIPEAMVLLIWSAMLGAGKIK